MAMQQSRLERENLEAHVDLCAERYRVLEDKLDRLDERFDRLEASLNKITDTRTNDKSTSTRMIIGGAATLIAGLLSTIVVLLIALNGSISVG